MTAPVRLQRYLAAAGVAARRKAEELITAGRVRVNGEIVRVLGTKVDPDQDQVEVDGEAVVAHDKFYVLFNKPKGCITAVTDDRGRVTVMDYLPNVPVPVKPVGRLDFYSEGVLLLTNDGELAARLLAPASHVPKTYHVKVHGTLRSAHLDRLREGVQLDDGTVTLPAEIELLPGESKHTWLGITIHEGKHRQIHRMIEALGFRVDKLQRVAFANLTFHDLRVGDARELTQSELNELRDAVGLDHSAVARGTWSASREDTDIPRRARVKALAEQDAAAAAAAGGGAGPSLSGGDADDAGAELGDAPDETDLDMIEDEDAQQETAFDEDDGAGSPAAPASAAGRFMRDESARRSPRGSASSRGGARGGGARGYRSSEDGGGARGGGARGYRSSEDGGGARGGGARGGGARGYRSSEDGGAARGGARAGGARGGAGGGYRSSDNRDARGGARGGGGYRSSDGGGNARGGGPRGGGSRGGAGDAGGGRGGYTRGGGGGGTRTGAGEGYRSSVAAGGRGVARGGGSRGGAGGGYRSSDNGGGGGGSRGGAGGGYRSFDGGAGARGGGYRGGAGGGYRSSDGGARGGGGDQRRSFGSRAGGSGKSPRGGGSASRTKSTARPGGASKAPRGGARRGKR